jgi:hypothetical protein
MKIIRVSKCEECPYCQYLSPTGNRCRLAGKYVPATVVIPDWCPLENCKDEKEGE